MSQIVMWDGRGEGTLEEPYVLIPETTFDRNFPFSVRIATSEILIPRNFMYFQFQDGVNDTKFLLAALQGGSNPLYTITSGYAHRFTAFNGLDNLNVVDGPYVLVMYKNINYMLRQQMFLSDEEEGGFQGPWKANKRYQVNDVVVLGGNLYMAIVETESDYFQFEYWTNISATNAEEVVISEDSPISAVGRKVWKQIEETEGAEEVPTEELPVETGPTETIPEFLVGTEGESTEASTEVISELEYEALIEPDF